MVKHFNSMKNNLLLFCRNARKNLQAGATKWLAAALLAMPASVVFAEGTKQVSPNVNNISAICIGPASFRGPILSDSAVYVNQRLRVRIADLNEKMYIGFHWRAYNSDAILSNMWMRIYDPNGDEVARYRFQSGQPGWIPANITAAFARAIAGPNGVDGTTDGYNPYVFTPTMLGEYSISLYQSEDVNGDTMGNLANSQKAPFWDITVA